MLLKSNVNGLCPRWRKPVGVYLRRAGHLAAASSVAERPCRRAGRTGGELPEVQVTGLAPIADRGRRPRGRSEAIA